ncbi:hypothetical protein OAK19_06680, partial [Aureispira]|nr:hypothetical protein [Aureispira sp.]
MNKNLEPLYTIIKERMDRYIFRNMLGETVADGIERFYLLKKSITEISDLDFASLLVESLGSEILDKKTFI